MHIFWVLTKIQVTQVDMQTPLVRLISQMNTAGADTWVDAGLDSCLEYIKRSKYLKVPDEYKELLLL